MGRNERKGLHGAHTTCRMEHEGRPLETIS